ncbi:type 4 pilus major pilin [Duganella radicis]|uniref:Pilus assembly protein n=1 Tax=Duganella radicis TaxID=551988 RepID=A0A6L6PSS8_9BURK|nr:type 4 pilus major pilin [Duganella radicis]MTV41727.1 pilus assembly protein [Duganella radicis]
MKQASPSVRRMLSNRARQRGASLLEGIAYLGIAALVVLGAVSLLTNAFGSAKSNQTTEEVVALRTAVRKLYAGQSYNDANMQANLITARAIPNTLVIAGNALSNSWSGVVTVASTAANTFNVTYNNVPQDVCISAVSGANGWTQIARDAAGGGAVVAFPVTATAAATLCNAANNTIVFTAN